LDRPRSLRPLYSRALPAHPSPPLSIKRQNANPSQPPRLWNFLISFFTPFITGDIDYRYGYVFAACNFAGAFIVYFFLCEHQGRTLEEIDTMYILNVKPWKSSSWTPPEGEDLVTADALTLGPGARTIKKADAAGMESENRVERLVPPPTESHGITDISGTDYDPSARPAYGRRGVSVTE